MEIKEKSGAAQAAPLFSAVIAFFCRYIGVEETTTWALSFG
jgi:hypothetical protein